jgi:probable HAF family extracellular repeat protein
MRTCLCMCLPLVAAACLFSFTASAVTQYTITDLGTLAPPSRESHARDINEAGQVVGYSRDYSNRLHAFLWENGTIQDLGTLGGTLSEADGINELGQIVGHADIPGNTRHAFLWESRGMQDLDPSSARHSWAWGINEASQVAGTLDLSGTGVTTFLWEDGQACIWEGSTTTLLPALGGSHSAAYDINESGCVVGWAETSSGGHNAVLWNGSDTIDLGTFGGVYSWAFAINDHGQVVGWRQVANGESRAFLWQDGVMTDLGLEGRAWDINNRGQVVCSTATTTYLWDNGSLYDLQDLIPAGSGWQLGRSVNVPAINDAGWIVGTGISPDGYTRAFLLTPIPEPPAVVLVSLGAFSLLLRRRKH